MAPGRFSAVAGVSLGSVSRLTVPRVVLPFPAAEPPQRADDQGGKQTADHPLASARFRLFTVLRDSPGVYTSGRIP